MLKVKAIAVSSAIARAPSTLPEARQIERGTRMTGCATGACSQRVTRPEAIPESVALQAEPLPLTEEWPRITPVSPRKT